MRLPTMRLPPRRPLSRLNSTSTSAPNELAGTVPAHQMYMILHTPMPIRTLESRPPAPLRLDMQRHLLQHSALVNLGRAADARAWARSERACSPALSSLGAAAEEDEDLAAEEDGEDEGEVFNGVAFAPNRAPLHLRGITAGTAAARAETAALVQRALPPLRRFARGAYDGPVHVYVCTHGARDCRCGAHGGALADALGAELKRRRKEAPGEGWERVVLGEVAHVGGHKHAANALVFPHGDWLGNLRAEHAPALLDALLENPFTNEDGAEMPPLMPAHWRGRMGMSMEEQREFIAGHLEKTA